MTAEWPAFEAALKRYTQENENDVAFVNFINSIKKDDPELFDALRRLFVDFYAVANSVTDPYEVKAEQGHHSPDGPGSHPTF